MARWIQETKKADFKALAQQHGIDQVVARVMINRGIKEENFDAFLHPSLSHLHDPYLMKDIQKAARIMSQAADDGKKIRIIGDYDVDGIMSTYILHQALLRMGANVDYLVPDRIINGYGLKEDLIEQAYHDGVEVIITCDNGIAAMQPVIRGKELGMTIVITDHHDIPFLLEGENRIEQIPPADAVVNPKQKDCPYPFSGICGAVVAWKLVFAMYKEAGISEDEAWRFLENAAFATVGDVMDLVDENRDIVSIGLKRLAVTENTGMRALIEENKLTGQPLRAYHIGFILGPCLNASGRLDTAEKAVQMLECTNAADAQRIAAELVELNNERKDMTVKGVDEAIAMVEEEGVPTVIVAYLPNLHESLAGLVAGRLKEKYYRPTFVITKGKDGAKGSGRSIPGFHMADHLQSCRALLSAYGGHAMAAGFSLPTENIEAFREQLNAEANLTEDQLQKEIRIDVPMPLSYITQPLVEQLELLQPCGNGNPSPLFGLARLSVIRVSYIGNGKWMKFAFAAGTKTMEGMYWQDPVPVEEYIKRHWGEAQWQALMQGRNNDVALTISYVPKLNEFRGNVSVQITVQDIAMDD